jgi:hypothetical protein
MPASPKKSILTVLMSPRAGLALLTVSLWFINHHQQACALLFQPVEQCGNTEAARRCPLYCSWCCWQQQFLLGTSSGASVCYGLVVLAQHCS